MPTGYTAGIHDGSITEFEEYALLCMRNFGACVSLRDEPMSPYIPEFEPSDYHPGRIKEAEEEIERIESLTDKEITRKQREKIQAAKKYRDKYIQRRDEQNARYLSMPEKARAFKAPTPEHEGYRAFMISQLEDSIRFDTGGSYLPSVPEEKTPDEWRADKLHALHENLAYHRKEYEEHVERVNARNEWVRQAKEAIRRVGK